MKKIIGTFFLLFLLTQIGWTQVPIQLGAWHTTTSLNTPRGSHASVAYNGYVYVIGGHNGTNYVNDVQYAHINADGSLGTWQNTTSFNTSRNAHTSVAYNGYLYVIGGNGGSPFGFNDVQYAPINSDGSLGAWQNTTSFTNGRWSHTSVVHNGYLYVIQGFYYSAASPLADVQFAKFNADGSLGAWQNTTSFSSARWAHASIAYNGYIYSMGGYNWNGSYYTLTDVQYSLINANGSLNSWQSTTPLNPSLAGPGLVEYDGNLIITGGQNIPAGNLNNVQLAMINADGSVGSWQNAPSFNIDRSGHTSVVYNEYLYVIGGRDNNGNVLNDVQYAKIGQIDTTPPVLNIPSDMVVEATGPDGAVANYSASAIDDIDGTVPVVYSIAPDSLFPFGVTTVTVTATDSAGNTATGTFTVTVSDTTPPVISMLTASPAVLWPPNNKFVPIKVSATVSDICDPSPGTKIISVSSNEPAGSDAVATGDAVITGDMALKLRAQRNGNGNGRVYTITVQCKDNAGNITTGTVDVICPHDQGKEK